ncbi:PEP-utilizing enzyme, TIM barrel domain, putative [Verrucomicrobiia bacterium DG1235]|nr:PEP-utilizing enzyme, TIM barrel domain, putative [Verrucomicrobiae bacterium DG1235]
MTTCEQGEYGRNWIGRSSLASEGLPIEIDGEEISVSASAHCVEDVDVAFSRRASAIGLVRIERVMAAEGRILDSMELETELGAIACASEGRCVTFRLADFSPNKVSGAIESKLPRPVCKRQKLGLEYLLYNYDILKEQIVALVRLAQFNPIRVLVPMVEDGYEMLLLRLKFKEEAERLKLRKIPVLGAMLESRLAVRRAFSISKQSNFLAVGSNDLAINVTGRGEQGIWETHDVEFDDPRLFAQLERLNGILGSQPLELYGGLAHQPEHLRRLLQLGFRSFCVKPDAVVSLRKALSELN